MSLMKKTDTQKFRDKTKKKRKINTKKLQYGTLSVVLTVVFIAVIVLVNAGVSYLTDRYSLKADISAAGYYQISEQTEAMLKNLSEPVTCYILMSESDVQASTAYSVSAEFLKRFETLSNGMFSVEYVDVYKNPTFMNRYDENSGVSVGSFIIESEKRYRVCSLYDLYEISNSYDDEGNLDTQYISGFDADEQFASMLHYVTTGQLPTVCLVTGHGESYGDDLREIFDSNNYDVVELNLMLEDIPSGTDMLVIGAPYTDYTEDEIEKLDRYFLEDFGSAMVFMSYGADRLDNLENYFAEWGVEYSSTLVLDSKRALTLQPMVVPFIQKTDLSGTMSFDSNTLICTPFSRAINVLWDERSSRSVTVELQTSDSAYAKAYGTDKNVSTFLKEDGDAEGTFNVAVMSEYWQWINNRAYYARILFFGTPNLAEDSMLETKALYNKQYLTAAISYLTPSTDAITLTARDLTSTEMAVLDEQANVILVALVVVLPVLVVALGVVVWLKRRNK
ncbi:MAG: GldG family protein [Clostridiaceae bacterium]|nr:GldG family protein [Clostridiaceae bacterium]